MGNITSSEIEMQESGRGFQKHSLEELNVVITFVILGKFLFFLAFDQPGQGDKIRDCGLVEGDMGECLGDQKGGGVHALQSVCMWQENTGQEPEFTRWLKWGNILRDFQQQNQTKTGENC